MALVRNGQGTWLKLVGRFQEKAPTNFKQMVLVGIGWSTWLKLVGGLTIFNKLNPQMFHIVIPSLQSI